MSKTDIINHMLHMDSDGWCEGCINDPCECATKFITNDEAPPCYNAMMNMQVKENG
jgi:hypothetical protein